MIRPAAALLALALSTGAAADVTYSVTVPGTKDTITLFKGAPCTSAKVLKLMTDAGIPREIVDSAQGATSEFGGVTFEACYVDQGDVVVVIYEDGATGVIPKNLFTVSARI